MIVIRERRHHVLRLRLDIDHAEKQQSVVSGERATRLADDMRHRKLELAARFGESVHDVVRVFLQRVVDARLRRGLRSVVIDSQPAADIHVRHVDAHAAKLRVVTRNLLQSRLDVADVGDLRPKVEVDQLENVESIFILQAIDELHELCGAQSEFRFLAAALRPTSRPFGVQLDAHASRGIYTELVRDFEQHVDFTQLLDDDEHLVTELLPHESEAHELLVLVAIAHDEVIGVLGEREHRLKLGLAAALEANARVLSELDDFLDDVPLLIDLDRKYGRVLAGVFVLANCAGEPLRQ